VLLCVVLGGCVFIVVYCDVLFWFFVFGGCEAVGVVVY